MQGKSLPYGRIFTLAFFILMLGAGAIGLWYASRYVEPAPPASITISTGSMAGAYYRFGGEYAATLAKSGVTLNVVDSNGSLENLARLRDPLSKVDVALVQGGLREGSGAAPSGLLSLGRMFLEPVWIFYRSDRPWTSLKNLRGRRVAIGPVHSGTEVLSRTLLQKNGIDSSTTTLLTLGFEESATALRKGDADAIILTLAPDVDLIRDLLLDPSLSLMSLSDAEAYTRLFPYLTRITLPRGVIDLEAGIPPADVDLLANEAALVVRASLHPAVIGLLADAAKRAHSDGELFHRYGAYPKVEDSEYRLSEDAARFYQSGPPFLQRYLPFWVANAIERKAIVLLPLATMLYPILRGVPLLYQWRNRRRFTRKFARLKALERQLETDRSPETSASVQAELEAMEAELREMAVPAGCSDQYFNLRAALELIRQRVLARL